MSILGCKRVLTVIAMFSLIGVCACSSSSVSPIVSREPPPSRKINSHEVQPGDTLYSIAWRYETDYRELARINGLSEPFLLKTNALLKIYDDGQVSVARSSPSTQAVEVGTQESASRAKTAGVHIDSSVRVETGPSSTRASSSIAKSGAGSSQSSTSAAVPKVERERENTGFQMSSEGIQALPNNVKVWKWPVVGKVMSAFGEDKLTRGIVIDPGAEKQVRAAADGRVVYAGTGIRGFGNLLIVKHTDLLLSAYAYNSSLLVKEGDAVAIGQPIANVGNGLSGEPRVYFEIRRDGTPVDPAQYLSSH